jgi:hypothetical protein
VYERALPNDESARMASSYSFVTVCTSRRSEGNCALESASLRSMRLGGLLLASCDQTSRGDDADRDEEVQQNIRCCVKIGSSDPSGVGSISVPNWAELGLA